MRSNYSSNLYTLNFIYSNLGRKWSDYARPRRTHGAREYSLFRATLSGASQKRPHTSISLVLALIFYPFKQTSISLQHRHIQSQRSFAALLTFTVHTVTKLTTYIGHPRIKISNLLAGKPRWTKGSNSRRITNLASLRQREYF